MWVLILIYASHGITTAEFNSREACEHGLKVAKQHSTYISGSCTPKGRR